MRHIEMLLRDGLRTRFQPIVSLLDGETEVVAFEALSAGPEGTNFADASVMFAYARRLRIEHELDRRCMELAISRAHELPAEPKLSVNLHASTIAHDPSFHAFVGGLLSAQQFDPQRLIVEIVEHSTVMNEIHLTRGIDRLRALGAEVALDDVGLGFSNYKTVVDVDPDYLKIDRYFVHGAHADERKRKVLRSVRQLADEFESVLIAEGIETEADLLLCADFGIALGQGYLFAPALEVEDVPTTLLRFQTERGRFLRAEAASR